MHFIVESKLERGLCDFQAWSPNSRTTSVFSKVIFVGKNRLRSASNFEVILTRWPCLFVSNVYTFCNFGLA